jgi:1-acyl-sn-glycerol-3-phosphate acyltransferase
MEQDWLSHLWYAAWKGVVAGTLSLGFSFRFEGGRHVPRTGPVLVVANHQSFLDPVAIGLAVPRQLHFLARKTLFVHPLFGAFLRSVNCVPVDQQGVAKEGLQTTIELLKKGRPVLVFPEGERTWKGPMQPLKAGVYLLIKRTRCPIVPVGVAGAFDAMPRTRTWPTLSPLFWPATGTGVAVSVGAPLDGAHFAELPREQALEELFGEIRNAQRRAERLRRK